MNLNFEVRNLSPLETTILLEFIDGLYMELTSRVLQRINEFVETEEKFEGVTMTRVNEGNNIVVYLTRTNEDYKMYKLDKPEDFI